VCNLYGLGGGKASSRAVGSKAGQSAGARVTVAAGAAGGCVNLCNVF